jgi:hypothetical protein
MASTSASAPHARDIDENRRGRLSAGQAAFIAKLKQSGLAVWMAIPLVGLQVGGALLTTAFTGGGNVATAVLSGAAGVAVLAGTVLGALYLWRRRGTLAHQNITWLDGRMIWAGTPSPGGWSSNAPAGWVPAGADGVPLPIQRAYGPMLPPGPWRFYFHDDRIVAAESPYDTTTYWSITQSPPISFTKFDGATLLPPSPLPVGDSGALLAVLTAGIPFTPEDLEHNRRGLLSSRQGAGRAFVVEGPLSLGWAMRTKIDIRYWWDVGGRRFEIPLPWIYLAPAGVVYRVYADERTERLLSMEPVTVPPDR